MVYIIYFDNASTTYHKPKCVYDAANTYLRHECVNSTRGQYDLASKSNLMIEQVREGILNLFHSGNYYKAVFTPSATISINTILHGLDFKTINNVYITHFEHNAVLRPLYNLRDKHNFKVHILTTNYNGKTISYNVEEIKDQFQSNNPDLVIVSHASNVCGLVAPIDEIFPLSKQYEAITVCDCSQTAGLLEIDALKYQIDFTIFAGHKTLYAPFGVGGFVTSCKYELKPLIYGGTGVDSVKSDMPASLPYRFEAGSLNTLAIAGLKSSLDWVNETGINNILEHEKQLTHELKQILSSYKNIKISGDNDGVGIVSCVLNGYSSDEIGYVLNNHNIAVRTGLHCAPLAHEFLGTAPDGTVRFSLSYFNTSEELEKLNKVLKFIRDHS